MQRIHKQVNKAAQPQLACMYTIGQADNSRLQACQLVVTFGHLHNCILW